MCLRHLNLVYNTRLDSRKIRTKYLFISEDALSSVRKSATLSGTTRGVSVSIKINSKNKLISKTNIQIVIFIY